MKLTRKQAFDLSIRKWKALAKGEPIPNDIVDMGLYADCGLCEKYVTTENARLNYCAKCPIRLPIKEYDDIKNASCAQSAHPFDIYWFNKSPENAQKVLDLILASRNKRLR